ncbi:methyltransferase domain-containing protein [Pigmentiphaga aceris]|uniref:Methyltransferase domain-containing protein n=1 Tax=Pigmentiphaga aceris TaxID=1940612 RepID=A0A5C0AUZ9_9BURK|nr:methyltransferase domain-containing protein [Pigmentiphaga aceris]QEI06168.1 methyltransferase domain-containing protein [Pigmentiphaga aceris]
MNTIDDIDFSALWRSHMVASGRPPKPASDWDAQAARLVGKSLRSDYADAVIARMDFDGADSLLDVGCGAGTICLNVADRLQRVIGLDYSAGMLAALRANANAAGLSNVDTIERAWDDDWRDVPECDIVVASRASLVVDIGDALARLHAKARQRVYVTHLVGGHFLDPAIQRAIGRRLPALPDYIYLVNVLHAMGVQPKLDYIDAETGPATAPDFETLAQRVDKSARGLSDEERDRLRNWFDAATPAQRAGRPLRWALISWDKKDCL